MAGSTSREASELPSEPANEQENGPTNEQENEPTNEQENQQTQEPTVQNDVLRTTMFWSLQHPEHDPPSMAVMQHNLMALTAIVLDLSAQVQALADVGDTPVYDVNASDDEPTGSVTDTTRSATPDLDKNERTKVVILFEKYKPWFLEFIRKHLHDKQPARKTKQSSTFQGELEAFKNDVRRTLKEENHDASAQEENGPYNAVLGAAATAAKERCDGVGEFEDEEWSQLFLACSRVE